MNEETFGKAKAARGAKKWFRDHVGGECNYGVAAIENGKIVGYVRARLEDSTLELAGTWIAPSKRGSGLGTKLWRKLLTGLHANVTIDVVVISPGGRALAQKMSKEYSHFEWDIFDAVE